MSEEVEDKSIFDSLRHGEGEDIHISAEDMKQLVDILGFISEALSSGKIWFNKPGKSNQKHAVFCKQMAKKFANIKIEQEQ